MLNFKRFEYSPGNAKATNQNGNRKSVKRDLSSCDEENDKKLKKLNNGNKAKKSDFFSNSSGSGSDEPHDNSKENHVIPSVGSQKSQPSFENSFDSPIIQKRTKKTKKLVLDSDDSFQDNEKFNQVLSTNGHTKPLTPSQSSESPLKLKKRTRKKLLNISSSESDSDDDDSKKKFPRANVEVNGTSAKEESKSVQSQTSKSKQPSISAFLGKKKKKDVHVDASDYGGTQDDDVSMKDLARNKRHNDDDSSEEENIDGISKQRKDKILEFMKTASVEELSTVSNCSTTTSTRILECRPFKTWAELRKKISNIKGMGRSISTDGLLWGVEELLQERIMLQELMDKCSTLSDQINKEIEEMQMTHMSCNAKFLSKQPDSIPDGFNLKEYQMVGLNWLALLHRQGLNGILADEMGLGKTVQAIAFLAYLMEHNDTDKQETHVVVVPSSTLSNWQREFQTWCPKLRVTMYYGSQDHRRDVRIDHLKKRVKTDVFLSTYNLTTSQIEDRAFFRKMSLGYAVFDEGHMLKNMSTQRYQKLMKIQAKRRLLLTGTPLQNNLLELMSMLRFVMPDMFNETTETLVRLFISGNSETKSVYAQKCINQAKTLIEPFMLRRLKDEVLQELPDKVHKVVYCNMTKSQKKLYQATCLKYKNKKINELASTDMKNAFMELRKIANHPLLCRDHYQDSELRTIAKKLKKDQRYWDSNEHYIFEDMQVMTDFEMHNLCITHSCIKSHALSDEIILDSGKFNELDRVLPDFQKEGKRVLIFSQFTMMIDVFEAYLKIRGYKHLRLDGQTAVETRLELIDEFNNDPSIFIFMLSTKAGGLGINLTSASVVLLHDIDFNPYNDKQAEDRCHRVGQTQTVEIVRMLSKDSIEKGMMARAEYKLQLEQDVTNTDEIIPVAEILKEALGL